MPNNNNDEDLTNLSIEEINDLFSDIIEFPEDARLARNSFNNPGQTGTGNYCSGK